MKAAVHLIPCYLQHGVIVLCPISYKKKLSFPFRKKQQFVLRQVWTVTNGVAGRYMIGPIDPTSMIWVIGSRAATCSKEEPYRIHTSLNIIQCWVFCLDAFWRPAIEQGHGDVTENIFYTFQIGNDNPLLDSDVFIATTSPPPQSVPHTHTHTHRSPGRNLYSEHIQRNLIASTENNQCYELMEVYVEYSSLFAHWIPLSQQACAVLPRLQVFGSCVQ